MLPNQEDSCTYLKFDPKAPVQSLTQEEYTTLHPLDKSLYSALNGDFDMSFEILKSMPDNDLRVTFNLGLHYLQRNQFQKGFEHLDAGRYLGVFGSPTPLQNGIHIWQPSDPLQGKTLLFKCECGFGDQIINVRFAKFFKDQGADVIIACDKALFNLFKKSFPWVSALVAEEGAQYVFADYWLPAMSAPRLCCKDFSDLPGQPYINLYTSKPKKSRTLKVGLRWLGNQLYEHSQHRLFPSDLMLSLQDIDNCDFYSLQKDNDTSDLPRLSMDTWEETAKSISKLDLVISSCTSILHLSAAMGIETWGVIPVLPYYCWALPGPKSPWYDSLTLYRQVKYGDWSAPFDQVRRDLLAKTS